ncbi:MULTISPECIES: type II toxin-antitoxin system RelE/ParE family toxin [unclassified Pseudomonas]|uniref:type II toxin-antitoxin system RelE/ParE family toxin n=1 Tax=unclassified Pseudomonas TaxID=196821 RepID=UPI00384FC105
MLTVEWSKYAKADLLAILAYISDHDSAAAWRLKDEIDLRIGHLPQHPRLYKTGREPGTREMVVMPNYLVIYAENACSITILRVLHAAQQWPSSAE